jgi:hypothetical protein
MPPVEVPFRFEAERMLWWVDDVYTRDECRRFMQRIESARPELATNNPIYRDQDRVIVDDGEVASDLFQRLRPHLPSTMGDLQHATMAGVVAVVRAECCLPPG